MNEKEEFLNFLNEQVDELSETTSEGLEMTSEPSMYSDDINITEQTESVSEGSEGLEITEEEIDVGTSNSEDYVEYIAIEPDILYEKLDSINSNLSAVSLCSLIIIVYFIYEFIGRFFHIRKEGDL